MSRIGPRGLRRSRVAINLLPCKRNLAREVGPASFRWLKQNCRKCQRRTWHVSCSPKSQCPSRLLKRTSLMEYCSSHKQEGVCNGTQKRLEVGSPVPFGYNQIMQFYEFPRSMSSTFESAYSARRTRVSRSCLLSRILVKE